MQRPLPLALGTALLTILVIVFLFQYLVQKTAFSKESVFARVTRTGEIRCGYGIAPPFMQIDPNTGALSGINIDIMEAIGKNLELKIVWTEETGWGNYIESMKAGRFDVFCSTVWPNGARTKNSTLTKPTLYTAQFVAVRAGDHRFDGHAKKLNDPSVRFSVIENDVSHSIAKESYPRSQLVLLPPSSDWGMQLVELITGKADATFVDLGLFKNFEARNPGKAVIIDAPPSRVFGETISVPLGEHDLENMLNASITTLGNSGVIKALLDKYPDNNYYPPAPEFLKN